MGKTTVINIKDRPNWKAEGAIYIGRENPRRGIKRSLFHNPFKIGKDGTRDEVFTKYYEYFIKKIADDEEFRSEAGALAGKTLACWCAPERCHGDVLASFADGYAVGRAVGKLML